MKSIKKYELKLIIISKFKVLWTVGLQRACEGKGEGKR